MISVIVPIYNSEATITAALDSVKNQITEEIFEIFVINDGSTDSSRKIVEKYISEHANMNITLLNQQNKGVSAARNAGLKLATGDFIALLDADDEWLPEKTEKQLSLLKNENLGIDFLTSLWNSEKVNFPYKICKNGLVEINLKKLLIKITGQTSTAIFKKEIIESGIYFDEHQRYSEDANFWMKINKEFKMSLLPEVLVIAGSGKRSFGVSGLSANLSEMEKGIQKNLREMHEEGRISRFEYRLYYLFSKFKYLVRVFLRSRL